MITILNNGKFIKIFIDQKEIFFIFWMHIFGNAFATD
jgi:hypothetical protein